MALTTAVGVGAAAALVVPLITRGHEELLGGILTGGLLHLPLLDWEVHWSWPIFCIVTLAAWAFLTAARES